MPRKEKQENTAEEMSLNEKQTKEYLGQKCSKTKTKKASLN